MFVDLYIDAYILNIDFQVLVLALLPLFVYLPL